MKYLVPVYFSDLNILEPIHVCKGLFLSLVALAGGDISKLKLTFIPDAPFIEVTNDAFEGDLASFAIDLFKSFVKFIKAVKTIVFDNLPDLLSQAKEFPG